VQLAYALSDDVAVVPDKLLAEVSSLPSPTGVGLLFAPPAAPAVLPGVATVVLDRLQDAGNVGSILRSAAALGVRQVIALRGTAGLWSPKVLRAGMGAQFGLHLLESQEPHILNELAVPLLATSSHTGAVLPQGDWPQPCAWIFGHEGQGVREDLLVRCTATVRIPQPGGEESLNVAAAAAICLYEALRRRGPG
jgi:RNA methyltransferase, TrmH family